MSIISKFNKYFEQKCLQNKNNFKFNLGLGYCFSVLMLGTVNINFYDTLFYSALKISIEQPLVLHTNLQKYRSYPNVRIKYNDTYLFSHCKRIEIEDFCNLYPKQVNILSMQIRPNYTTDSFFIYSMIYLDNQGKVQHYNANIDFEQKHKIPLLQYIMIYINIFMFFSCIYFTWLYHKVTKSYSIQN